MATLKVPVLTSEGKEAGSLELSPAVFGVAFNDPMMHQVVTGLMAQKRQVLAHTKGKGDVRGGGKKPWKQKGTGRARHGSSRSPIWVGGGITFGPTKDRNFYQKVNKQMRQAALRMALSDKVASEHLIVVDAWTVATPKTKALADVLKKLPSASKKSLVVTMAKDKNVIQASKNLAKVMSIGAANLNVLDVMKYDYLVASKEAVAMIQDRYKK